MIDLAILFTILIIMYGGIVKTDSNLSISNGRNYKTRESRNTQNTNPRS